MLMTPPPGNSPSTTAISPSRQSSQLLAAPGRPNLPGGAGGAAPGIPKLGSAFPGGISALSNNPMGQQQQQQMMLMKLLRGY